MSFSSDRQNLTVPAKTTRIKYHMTRVREFECWLHAIPVTQLLGTEIDFRHGHVAQQSLHRGMSKNLAVSLNIIAVCAVTAAMVTLALLVDDRYAIGGFGVLLLPFCYLTCVAYKFGKLKHFEEQEREIRIGAIEPLQHVLMLYRLVLADGEEEKAAGFARRISAIACENGDDRDLSV